MKIIKKDVKYYDHTYYKITPIFPWLGMSGVYRRRLFLSVVIAVVLFSIGLQIVFSDGFNLSGILNLSGGSGNDQDQTISVSGQNVYVTWENNTNSIMFRASINNGSSFTTTTISSVGTAKDPKIASNIGTNVYLTYDTGTALFFNGSSNRGTSFSAKSLSGAVTTIASKDIAANNGTNVYVIWIADEGTGFNEVFFQGSSVNGTNFLSGNKVNIYDIGSGALAAEDPNVSANNGTNVYVIWKDIASPSFDSEEIFFMSSFKNGTDFPTTRTIISNDDAASSNNAKLAMGNLTNVYVVWQDFEDGNNEIYFQTSFKNGTDFSSANRINLSNTAASSTLPEIAASGNHVYVAWLEDVSGSNDIFFKASSLNGTDFASVSSVNLSSDAANSAQVRVSAFGSNVFVIWRDPSLGSGDILMRFSTDFGATFSSTRNISSTTDNSRLPEIDSSKGKVHVVWQELLSGSNNEIFYVSGTQVPATISFNTTASYRLSETAKISITDQGSNTNSGTSQTISVLVTSTIAPGGINVNLVETGPNTAVFEGTLTFSTTSSNDGLDILRANPGNTITASFGTVNNSVTIFPRTVAFTQAAYNPNESAILRVTDQNSNLTASVETITATVTSTSNPSGITINLIETEGKSGIFENEKLIFMNANNLFSLGDTIVISQTENVGTTGGVDNINVLVNSTTDQPGFTLTLTETGPVTNLFKGKFTLTSGSSSGSPCTSDCLLQSTNGDIVDVIYLGARTRGLVTPNSNAAVGAIVAPIDDDVNASYLGTAATQVDIVAGVGGGGGGGGLLRPGLVVDVVGSLLAGGSGRDGSAPSLTLESQRFTKDNSIPPKIREIIDNYDPLTPIPPVDDDGTFDFPLSIEGKGYALAGFSNTLKPQKVEAKKPITIKTVLFEQSRLEHISLYANIRNFQTLYESDLSITFDNGKVTIKDSQGFFENANVKVNDLGTKKEVIFEMTFSKPMQSSDMVIRSWDEKRRQNDVNIYNAFEVVPPSPKNEIDSIEETTDEKTTNEIADSKVISATKVTREKVLMWAGFSDESISDADFLKEIDAEGDKIPSWYKKTAAKGVYDNMISEDDIANAIKFLEKKGLTTQT